MRQAMLTTIDNPFDPFEDFRSWDAYDRQAGYFTSSYLARIAQTSDGLSEQEYHDAVEDAIDEIVFENVLGIYRKAIKNE